MLLATVECGEPRTILHGDRIAYVMIADGAHKLKAPPKAFLMRDISPEGELHLRTPRYTFPTIA